MENENRKLEREIRYGKPSMTNLPTELGRAIFKQMLNTPKPDMDAIEKKVRELEKYNLEVRKREESERTPVAIPRIKTIEPLDDLVLKVTFDGGEEVLYDVKDDVKDIPDFRPLETDSQLFNNFTLDSSRTCVTWTCRIDLPSDTILEYGKKLQKSKYSARQKSGLFMSLESVEFPVLFIGVKEKVLYYCL